MSGIVGTRSAAARHTARRHRLYRRLLLLMLVQVVFTALPWKLHRLGMAMTAVVLLFLLSELGQLLPAGLRAGGWSNRLYRLLGLAGVVALTSWLLVPATVNWHGLLLVVLIVLFVFWSLLRLLQLLREEEDVGRPVLAGAVAGYLMLGFSGGLALSVLETVQPGSFVDVVSHKAFHVPPATVHIDSLEPAWDIDFTRINYFAFVSLTTVGYGDIVPVRRLAQMTSVSLSVVGPLYLAMVMGLLISRFTVQTQEGDDEASDDRSPP